MKPIKACIATFSFALAAALPAHAEDGRHMISGGWLHVDNRTDSSPLTTTQVRNGSSTTEPGTSFSAHDADTVALIYTYAFDAHLSGQFVAGYPPPFELTGQGTSSFVGDLEQYGTLAEAKQLSPTAIAIYTFRDPAEAFRPYVGLGVTYTRFTDIELNPALEQAFVNAVKTRTGGAAQQVSVRAEAESSWDPVVVLGAEYRFAPRWYAIGSVSYLPLDTRAAVTTTITQSANPALLPTGDFTRSEAEADLDPIVTFLGVGYRF